MMSDRYMSDIIKDDNVMKQIKDDNIMKQIEDDNIMKQIETESSTDYKACIPKIYGWICPVCGRGLSPFTNVCPCRNKWEITC